MYAQRTTSSQINFMASEKFVSFTESIDSTNYNVQTDENGRKYVPAGTVYPTNDAKAIGVTIDDVYVDHNPALVGVIRAGWVLNDKLPVAPAPAAIAAMPSIHFMDADNNAVAGATSTTSPATGGTGN